MGPYETYYASWNDYDCWSENSSPLKIMDFVCQSDVHSIFKQIEGGNNKNYYVVRNAGLACSRN